MKIWIVSLVAVSSAIQVHATFGAVEPVLERAAVTLSNPADAHHSWLKRVYARVVNSERGSTVIWRNPYSTNNTALLLSARHTKPYEYAAEGKSQVEFVKGDPSDAHREVFRFRHWAPTPEGLARRSGAAFISQRVYSPEMPADVMWGGQGMAALLPRHDFVIESAGPYEALPRDLLAWKGSDQAMQPGDLVMGLGYPMSASGQSEELMYTVGRIASEERARELIAKAGAKSVPFDPKVEFLVEGIAARGMSGGGVFDREGRPIGVMIRAAGNKEFGYFRAVRESYILDRWKTALQRRGLLPGSPRR